MGLAKPENVKLDKDRSYGTIIGDSRIAFEQDGINFDIEGNSVERWTTPEALQNERILREKRLKNEARLARMRAQQQLKRRLLEEIEEKG